MIHVRAVPLPTQLHACEDYWNGSPGLVEQRSARTAPLASLIQIYTPWLFSTFLVFCCTSYTCSDLRFSSGASFLYSLSLGELMLCTVSLRGQSISGIPATLRSPVAKPGSLAGRLPAMKSNIPNFKQFQLATLQSAEKNIFYRAWQ